MSEQLTPLESSQLEKLEAIITKGKESFFDVGRAIMEIREGRLYRRDYSTFEGYCQGKWGWSRHRASQIENSAIMAQGLTPKVLTMVNSERAARALVKVKPSEREAVVKRAAANGPVTAKAITLASKPTPDIALDEEGCPIPKGCVEIWNRRQEVQDLMARVSAIKCQIQKAHKDGDMLLLCIQPYTVTQLEAVYYSLTLAKPYAVCTECEGHPVEAQCTFCCGTGLISKHAYDTQSKMEIKAIRKRTK